MEMKELEAKPALLVGAGYYTEEQEQLLKDTICKGATVEEFKLFLYTCKRTGLDPFARQIYAVKRWNSKLKREEMTCQTGIDGFRAIAARTGKYRGQTPIEWCGKNGKWIDVWLANEPPCAARVGVFHADFTVPLVRVAVWDSYEQSYWDEKSQTNKLSKFWAKMPDLMLAKCAESLALRAAFPQELSGLYTDDEIGDIEHADHQPSTLPKPKQVPSDEKAAAIERTEHRKRLSQSLVQIFKDNGIVKDQAGADGVITKVLDTDKITQIKNEFRETHKIPLDRDMTNEELDSFKAWIEREVFSI